MHTGSKIVPSQGQLFFFLPRIAHSTAVANGHVAARAGRSHASVFPPFRGYRHWRARALDHGGLVRPGPQAGQFLEPQRLQQRARHQCVLRDCLEVSWRRCCARTLPASAAFAASHFSPMPKGVRAAAHALLGYTAGLVGTYCGRAAGTLPARPARVALAGVHPFDRHRTAPCRHARPALDKACATVAPTGPHLATPSPLPAPLPVAPSPTTAEECCASCAGSDFGFLCVAWEFWAAGSSCYLCSKEVLSHRGRLRGHMTGILRNTTAPDTRERTWLP